MKDFLLVNVHNQFTGDRVAEIRNSIPTGAVIRKNDPFKDSSALIAQPLHETEYYAKLTENNPTLLDVIPVAEDAEMALMNTILDLATRGLKVETTSQDPGLDGDELNTMPPNAQLNRNPRMPMFKTHDGVSFYQIGVNDHLIDGVKISRVLDSDKTFTMRLQVPIVVDDLVLIEKALTKFVNGELDNANFIYKKSEELLLVKQLEAICNRGDGRFMQNENAANLFPALFRTIDSIALKSIQTDSHFKSTVEHVNAIMAVKQNARFVGDYALDPRGVE